MLRQVLIDKSVLNAFKRRALRRYPNELLEIALGKVEGEAVHIYAFEQIEHTATDRSIEMDDDAHPTQDQDEYEHTILGTVHSHPDDDFRPSLLDKRSAKKDGEIVYGICAIRKSTSGRRLVSWGFWSGATHHLLELVIAE